jgi:hypothetical protein
VSVELGPVQCLLRVCKKRETLRIFSRGCAANDSSEVLMILGYY